MIVVWILLAVMVTVGGGWLFLSCPALRRHPDRHLLNGMCIAHRGLHDLFDNSPENSLGAFRMAVQRGLPIEIDIHITADGQVVVFHDSSLKRMCGADVTVEASTLKQLKAYRLNGTDQTIPTLQECLDTVAGKVPLMIEFKCPDEKICRWLCEAADGILRGYTGKYFVQSFYPPVLKWYRKHRPDICRGQLSAPRLGKNWHYRLLGKLLLNWISRPDFVSYDQNDGRCSALRWNVRLGAFPVGWTFRNQQQIERGRPFFRTYIFESFLPVEDEVRKNP